MRSALDLEYRNQNTYLKACKKYNTAPVSTVMRNMNEERISLNHHNLGPTGVKAVAIALVNNVNVRSLDLQGNDLGVEGALYIQELMSENNYIVELVCSWNESNFLDSWTRLPWTRGYPWTCESTRGASQL